jgi:hypothetical protein
VIFTVGSLRRTVVPACADRPAARGLDRAQAVRDQRALLRHRVALVQLATSLPNRVHAVLAERGTWVQERLWSVAARAWLASLALPRSRVRSSTTA